MEKEEEAELEDEEELEEDKDSETERCASKGRGASSVYLSAKTLAAVTHCVTECTGTSFRP